MSVFGASRFTAILAALAISGTAATFWWAIETRADLKANKHSADRALSSKPGGRGLRPKDERSGRFELMGRSERAQPSPAGRVEDGDPLPEQSAARVFVNYADTSHSGGADMPLPIPPAPSNPTTWQVKAPDPLIPGLPPPAESQKHQTREPRPESAIAAATPSPKPSVRSYYLEKVVEQGDAGEPKFKYRRQSCEPPNMPDVCFMPQANRRGIVVERR